MFKFIESFEKKAFFEKCNGKEQTVSIENDSIVLRIGRNCKKMVPIESIKEIIYNKKKDDDNYYFRIVQKNSQEQIEFDIKYDLEYGCKDSTYFQQVVKEKNIKLSPDFGQYGHPKDKRLLDYCKASKAYLLAIGKHNGEFLVCYGDFNQLAYKKISCEDFDLKKELNCTISEEEDDLLNEEIVIDYGVYILDKKISFDKYYYMIPFYRIGVHQTYVINSQYRFFPSNSISEIQDKVIEYFKNKKL